MSHVGDLAHHQRVLLCLNICAVFMKMVYQDVPCVPVTHIHKRDDGPNKTIGTPYTHIINLEWPLTDARLTR